MILDNVLAGLKTSEASIDTFNSWSKNTYTSVAGWRLFDDSSEKFGVSITLARKIKAVNLAGGGYVSAQFVDGFESVAAATQWAKANRVTISKPFVPVEPEQEDAHTYWETPECPECGERVEEPCFKKGEAWRYTCSNGHDVLYLQDCDDDGIDPYAPLE